MLEQVQPVKVKLKKQKQVPSHLAAILALKQQQSETKHSNVEPPEEPLEKALEHGLNGNTVDNAIHPMFRPKDTLEPDSERSLVKVGWTKQGNLVLSFDTGEKLISSPVPVENKYSSSVVVGGGSSPQDLIKNSFETVSKNLSSADCQYVYTAGLLTSLIYSNGVTKTLTYQDGVLTEISLSGNTPTGITLTKTLTYLDGNLSQSTYS